MPGRRNKLFSFSCLLDFLLIAFLIVTIEKYFCRKLDLYCKIFWKIFSLCVLFNPISVMVLLNTGGGVLSFKKVLYFRGELINWNWWDCFLDFVKWSLLHLAAVEQIFEKSVKKHSTIAKTSFWLMSIPFNVYSYCSCH